MSNVKAEDLALPRETGEEKSTVACATCGEQLPVVESTYGSTSPGACPVCWPKGSSPSQLDAQTAAVAAADAVTEAGDQK